MKITQYRLIRGTMLAMSGIFSAIFLYWIFSDSIEDLTFEKWVFLIRGVILMTIGIVVVIKLPRMNEHIFFALFLINFSFTSWLALESPVWQIDSFFWALTAGSFVYAMIKYPGASAQALYANYFKQKHAPAIYKAPVLFFTDDKKFWFVFFPLMIIARIAGHFLSNVFMDALNIVVNISGFIYFRISYNLAGKADRSRLAWILWGLVVALVVTLVELLIKVFYPDAAQIIFHFTFALTSATICIAIIMGVFFAGFLDTALVLRGTIVYSIMFLAVIFLFSFIEHYIEHGLAMMLHIESDLISAFMAGFLALAIQPVHKKLEHILPKF